jgi:hypothetical protein
MLNRTCGAASYPIEMRINRRERLGVYESRSQLPVNRYIGQVLECPFASEVPHSGRACPGTPGRAPKKDLESALVPEKRQTLVLIGPRTVRNGGSHFGGFAFLLRIEHLRDNLNAATLQLAPETIADLDLIAAT